MSFGENIKIGKCALMLALSEGKEEDKLKEMYAEKGYRCAVTSVGGSSGEVQPKINSAIVGACLNNNIIEKTPEDLHALMHATLEAKEEYLLQAAAPYATIIAIKIGIVRYERWIAVAFYGNTAMHKMTNHERVSMGIMHI